MEYLLISLDTDVVPDPLDPSMRLCCSMPCHAVPYPALPCQGSYFETIGYGCPISTDRGVVHEHDSVQPEAGKISEDMDFDLTLLHKRVSKK